jgi:hypothetical protein
MAPQRILLFFVSASLCLGRLDPEWKLGTVADVSLLRPSSTLDTPVYAPSGIPIADVPGVQLMAIQSTQLAIIGEKTAYIIDKPGPPRPRRFQPQTGCALTPRGEVLFYQEKTRLYVLDDSGEVCKLAIVGQEALHPEK